jgi:amino acid efflux transporter
VISPLVVLVLAGLAAGVGSTDDLVRATSALFIAVYVLALASAARILEGRVRGAAVVSLAGSCVLAVFSAWFLIVPIVAAVASVLLRRRLRSPTAPSTRGLRQRDRDQDDRRADQLDAAQ